MLKSVDQTREIMFSFIKSVIRQKTVLFSSFILPFFTLWSTWWVTADVPMSFRLYDDSVLVQSMLDIHIFTGALTAIAITSGILSFLLTAANQKNAQRLRIMGYSQSVINLGWFLALLTILVLGAIGTFLFAIYLLWPKDLVGVFIAILLTTAIYSAVGYLVGILFPKVMEGTLIVLIFSFIDLMLISNPMGGEVYLSSWTYYFPGFWPTQLVMRAGFFSNSNYLTPVLYSLLYVFILLLIPNLGRLGVKDQLSSYLRKVTKNAV